MVAHWETFVQEHSLGRAVKTQVILMEKGVELGDGPVWARSDIVLQS